MKLTNDVRVNAWGDVNGEVRLVFVGSLSDQNAKSHGWIFNGQIDLDIKPEESIVVSLIKGVNKCESREAVIDWVSMNSTLLHLGDGLTRNDLKEVVFCITNRLNDFPVYV